MEIIHQENSNSYLFKAGPRRKTKFLFLLSDLSAFGNPVKKPLKIRGNYRKCMKILVQEEINEFNLTINDGEYFEIESPCYSRGRTKKDIKEYCGFYKKSGIKIESARLDVSVTIPSGNAIKVYSIKDGFDVYIVNDNGELKETNDVNYVEKVTGVYF